MTQRKTTASNASVGDFLNGVKNPTRRRDGHTVALMMQRITGAKAVMWGPSIVGYDTHRYRLANGKEAEICKVGFSPRAAALTFYLGDFEGRERLLDKLGKHRLGAGGCMYINKLADVDLEVLEQIIERAYRQRSAKGC